jgi:hypothetical protein
MRFFAGKVLILLTIALALANARCFSRCLVQPCGQQGSMSCHSHGKSNSANCAHHHDMTAAAAGALHASGECPFVLAGTPAGIELEASQHTVAAEDPAPPWSADIAASQPLRI